MAFTEREQSINNTNMQTKTINRCAYAFHFQKVLFISYKFVKYFLAFTFYHFLFRAETYMICANVSYGVGSAISAGYDTRHRIPHIPTL